MQVQKKYSAACALALFAVGGAQAAEFIGDFKNTTTAQGWSITAERSDRYTEHALTPPTMDGSGWLVLQPDSNAAQVGYATSQTLLDTRLPMRIRYDYLSRSTWLWYGGQSGFHLIDPAKGPELHVQGKRWNCATSALLVNFTHESPMGGPCNGPMSLGQYNRVFVRAGDKVVGTQAAPMWLTCGDYRWNARARVPERDCATRARAMEIGMVHAVDATLTPNGTGYVLDLSIDGTPIYAGLSVPTQLPPQVQFGLWADEEGDGLVEVRNVRVTQDASFVSAVNGQCLDVGYGMSMGNALIAHPCHGRPNQVLRFVGDAIEVGDACLGGEFNGDQEGEQVTLNMCLGRPGQRWERTAAGQIRILMPGTPRCVTLAPDGRGITLQTCDAAAATQRFTAIRP